MTALGFAAVDLGAESGRVMLARLAGEALTLTEVHRFPNQPVLVPAAAEAPATLHWDLLRLWAEVQQGLAEAVRQAETPLAGLGVDAWGVDFALLDRHGHLLGNPVHYRDARTTGMLEAAFQRVPRAEIFERTGIQFMPINSLYQLLALVVGQAPALDQAAHFLTIPDVLNFWLSGRLVNEFSNATTTQCYDPRTGDWARPMLAQLGIPTAMFGPVVAPGTVLGPARPALGLGAVPVIAPACHDTGSAVAAVPMGAAPAIYLSSGTWSLMGVETPAPVITPQSLAYNFTNEGGVGGTFRLLKNIMGLWLVQECRRAWQAQGQAYSYAELAQLAEAAPAFGACVVPSDDGFLAPGDMPARLRAYCRETGQPEPEGPGAVIRCALESLALEYRWVAERLDELTGQPHPVIHIIGGGAQNALLNQFTADATGRTVIAGPVEATILGNVLVQALALGRLESLAAGRALVRAAFPTRTFTPGPGGDAWEVAYQRYLRLRG